MSYSATRIPCSNLAGYLQESNMEANGLSQWKKRLCLDESRTTLDPLAHMRNEKPPATTEGKEMTRERVMITSPSGIHAFRCAWTH